MGYPAAMSSPPSPPAPADAPASHVLSGPNPGVYVAHTGTRRGRGVYAVHGYASGDVVEIAPVVLFDGAYATIPAEIRELLFNWTVLAGAPSAHGLALGYGSLYNHDNPANLRYEADAARCLLRFIAARDVGPGEELTINYNAARGSHAPDEDTWFTHHGLAPLGTAPG